MHFVGRVRNHVTATALPEFLLESVCHAWGDSWRDTAFSAKELKALKVLRPKSSVVLYRGLFEAEQFLLNESVGDDFNYSTEGGRQFDSWTHSKTVASQNVLLTTIQFGEHMRFIAAILFGLFFSATIAVASDPCQGNPGQGSPGQGSPGQGSPGQGNPGQCG